MDFSLKNKEFYSKFFGRLIYKTKIGKNVLKSVYFPTFLGGRKRSINPAVLAVLNNDVEDDLESNASANSDDDPNKLWCICRQPHNNRFMICCDACEDWFHGKCVNITKAMGKEMEISGKEWTCPNCVKKKKLKDQPRITSFMSEDKGSNCIVCKKAARPNSVYCSDECILRHAQNAMKPAEGAQMFKVKDNRVMVFEKSSGRYLSGEKAPTKDNLKHWLKDHPTFQVVSPGSAQQKALLAKKDQLKSLSKKMRETQPTSPQPSTVQTKLKFSPGDQRLTLAKDRKSIGSGSDSPKTPRPSTSRVAEEKPKSTPVKSVKKPETKTTPPSSQKKDSSAEMATTRLVVKKTLKEHLLLRTKEEITDPKSPRLTEEEIEKFSENVEKELYDLFSKDLGKYRSKYRSLVFNIKDRKNLTLFKRICEKGIQPYRLVRFLTILLTFRLIKFQLSGSHGAARLG